MYLVMIAWLYVAVMMAIAEALSPVGSVLGAIITFVLYGVLPMGVLGYILNTPARRRARRRQLDAAPDASAQAPGAPVASVGKKPL